MKTNEKILYSLAYSALYVLALLPLNILYMISDMAYLIVRYILRYRRNTIRRNLINSFPDKSEKERLRIEKRFYHHLCDIFVETIKLLHISDSEMRQRISIYGCENVEELASRRKPIFVYLSHYGNWEWAQEVKKRYTQPKTTAEIYHRIADPVLDRIMMKIRGRWKGMLFPQDEAVRRILRLGQVGESFLIGFISDQRPHSVEDNQWITFLNQPTDMTCGAEVIGRRCKASFLYLDICKTRRGHYEMAFIPLIPTKDCKTTYPYTETYMRKLEKTIRKCPEYWLWSHKRWSHAERQPNITGK